jgi:GT2 family glycosyltransferase
VDVSVVIPTWNGRHLLERFLPSVFEATARYKRDTGFLTEILLIDDAGQDDTAFWLAREYPGRAELLIRKYNEGFAHACNTGFEHARFPAILLLNNDVLLDVDAIAPLVARLQQPGVFAVGCRTTEIPTGVASGVAKLAAFRRGFLRVHEGYELAEGSSVEQISLFVSGGACMFDAEKLRVLGGFDTLYAPFYWEDVELCYRAWKRGWRVLFEPSSRASHQVSSTIGARFDRREVRAIQHRNRLLAHWVNIHEPALFRSHVFHAIGLALLAPLRGDVAYLNGLVQALERRGEALARREREREAARLTDGDVLRLFEKFARELGCTARR